MSCDYYVHCATCKVTLEYASTRYDRHVPHVLIKHAEAIAALSGLRAETHGNVGLGDSSMRVDVDWFVQHAGHELVVIDECDRVDDRCGEFYQCDRCARSHQHCNLSKGHGGQHAGRLG